MDDRFLAGPNNPGLEMLTREQAPGAFRANERNGLRHTVWTFTTPFIGPVCDCDRTDCLTMNIALPQRIPPMFCAEHSARTDLDPG